MIDNIFKKYYLNNRGFKNSFPKIMEEFCEERVVFKEG